MVTTRKIIPRAEGKNRIILGTMTFGPDAEAGARVTDLNEYKKCLDTWVERGYNEIDTARVYIAGKQEDWTKQAGFQERGLICATKWYPNTTEGHSPSVLRKKIDESLAALGVDCLDIFYLHAADRTIPFATTLEALNTLHQEGKFKTLALSNFTAAEVAEVVMICKYNNWIKPSLYQGMYNCLMQRAGEELAVVLKRFGIDWVVYNPIAGGLLSGKVTSKDMVPKEGRFSDTSKSGAMYRARYFRNSTFEALKVLEEATQKAGLTMIELGLRWCVHHSALKLANKGGNDGIIIGVSSHAQLVQNLDNLEKGPLPDEVLSAIDEAWKIMRTDHPNYWHGDYVYGYDAVEEVLGEGKK